MTVHMFRAFVGRGSMNVADLEARMDVWLQQNARWEEDSVTHELTARATDVDGVKSTKSGVGPSNRQGLGGRT